MAVTSATQAIFDTFCDDDVNKALFHGHTYMANPTACAIALAAINLLQTGEIQRNISQIEAQHQQFIQKHTENPKMENLRTLGVILAFEVKTSETTSYYGNIRNQLYNFFIEEGVILRPVGNTIYVLPPYIIKNHQLKRVYEVIENAVNKVTS